MQSRLRLPFSAAFLASCLACEAAETVRGRYVVYGNGLSYILGVAEFEVWSGGENVVQGKADDFSLLCLTSRDPGSVASCFRNATDGRKDTLEKWPKTLEVHADGMGYTDGSLSHCAFEVDLHETIPIERIDLYRSRYMQDGRPFKMFGDLGWRYVLVLDEARRIVAREAWNVYQGDYSKHQGHWAFEPKPATGAPSGRVVPENSLNWLSEAEYIRDFLGRSVIDRSKDLSTEDKERLKRFEVRDDPALIRELGEGFFRVVGLDRPGLANVRELVAAERYAEALDAFKAPFLKTLRVMDKVYNRFEYTWQCETNSRVGMRARDLSNHVYADKQKLTVTRFTPGLLPPAKMAFPFQMRPLLLSYVATGEPRYLRAWEAMTDDWALGFQDAADADPKNLRDHFVLIGNPVMANLMDLVNASRENPGFVRELSGATLARFLMPILEEMPVSIWRVCRKCVFNHVFNAVNQGWGLSQALADFHSGQRLEKEIRQVMLRMYTLGTYRDGPMIEIGDEGHLQGVAPGPSALYGIMAMSPELRPGWFTPAFECFYLDRLRRTELATISHVSPDGTGIRTAPRRYLFCAGLSEWGDFPDVKGQRSEYPALAGLLQRVSVAMEPESRAVLDKVYGWNVSTAGLDKETRKDRPFQWPAERYHRPPEVVSDWLPYAGCWYFRGGWEQDDAFLHMLKQPLRNSLICGFWNPCYGHLGLDRFGTTPMAYRLRDYATPMLTVLATEIDKQRPCDIDGFLFTGSKQDTFTQAVEKPQPMRWHTDERIDFGEAAFEGDYVNIYHFPPTHSKVPKGKKEWEHGPARVNGVKTVRQIFQVRPARMFLQIDRIRYASDEEVHTNRVPLNLVLTEPGPETEKEFSNDQLRIDADGKTVKARNPGNPGVTYALFGQPEMTFSPYSINGAEYNYFPWPDPEEADPKRDAVLAADRLGKGFSTLSGPRRTTGRGVFASWEATGRTVVLSVLYASRPGEEPVRKLEDLSTDSIAGMRATTATGVVVTLLTARNTPARLESGAVSVDGEALMLVEEPKHSPTVMVLGAKDVTVAGKAIALDAPDTVFELASSSPHPSPLIAHPSAIFRPLDPPSIGPAVNVFTDSTTVTLSTDAPGAVIRYTTDVPASRLDEFNRIAELAVSGKLSYTVAAERLAKRLDEGETWQLYTGPFGIADDTFVRARTFRSGDEVVPTLRSAGTDVSAVSYGFFRRRNAKPAQRRLFRRLESGLAYDYLEDRWFALWTYANILPPRKTGTVDRLLDVSMRETDGPFGVRYRGSLDVPADGVYTFYGPDEFINNICEPGYDLRVYVDGEEWDLGQTWHGRGMWSVPLEKGLHGFMVTFADARARDIENQRVDLWRGYPDPSTTWRDVAPVLEVSGPGIERQALPNAWLKRD